MRALPLASLLLACTSLAACSIWKPPEISYDDTPHQATPTAGEAGKDQREHGQQGLKRRKQGGKHR